MKRRVFTFSGIALVLLLVSFVWVKIVQAQVNPASVAQSSSKSNLQIIRQTINPLSSGAKLSATYETKSPVHVVISVFSPAALMKNVKVSDYISRVNVDKFDLTKVKYTTSDGNAGSVIAVKKSSDSANHLYELGLTLTQVKQGENKIEYDYELAE